MAKHSPQILALARRGADARFHELVQELKLLTVSFPHLRDSIDRDELPLAFILRKGRDKAKTADAGRPTRGWSAAQRKAAAARMKAYWAEKKKK